MTRAGQLRHRITLQSVSTTPDSSGDRVEAFATFATVWARVEPLTGREQFIAQQIQSETNYRVEIRYRAGVVATMRVLFGGRTFEVVSVLNVGERNSDLHLMCRELL